MRKPDQWRKIGREFERGRLLGRGVRSVAGERRLRAEIDKYIGDDVATFFLSNGESALLCYFIADALTTEAPE